MHIEEEDSSMVWEGDSEGWEMEVFVKRGGGWAGLDRAWIWPGSWKSLPRRRTLESLPCNEFYYFYSAKATSTHSFCRSTESRKVSIV
jgi:hypothetical protein